MDIDEPHIILALVVLTGLLLWQRKRVARLFKNTYSKSKPMAPELKKAFKYMLRAFFWFLGCVLLALADFLTSLWERLRQGPP